LIEPALVADANQERVKNQMQARVVNTNQYYTRDNMPDLDKYKTPEIKNLQNHQVWDYNSRDQLLAKHYTDDEDDNNTNTNTNTNTNIYAESLNNSMYTNDTSIGSNITDNTNNINNTEKTNNANSIDKFNSIDKSN